MNVNGISFKGIHNVVIKDKEGKTSQPQNPNTIQHLHQTSPSGISNLIYDYQDGDRIQNWSCSTNTIYIDKVDNGSEVSSTGDNRCFAKIRIKEANNARIHTINGKKIEIDRLKNSEVNTQKDGEITIRDCKNAKITKRTVIISSDSDEPITISGKNIKIK